MKVVRLVSYGDPGEAFAIADVPEPDSPGPGEVLVAIVAAPVHPAHLLQARGYYGLRPELPAVPGEEGVGTVVAVGAGVTDLPAGQLVAIVPGTTGGLWAEQVTRRRADVVP